MAHLAIPADTLTGPVTAALEHFRKLPFPPVDAVPRLEGLLELIAYGVRLRDRVTVDSMDMALLKGFLPSAPDSAHTTVQPFRL